MGGAKSHGLVRMCCFHPAYGYEDFIEGYRPELHEGRMSFTLRDGIFKEVCRDAEAQPERQFYLIIDEINRGDIPRIFGELLTIIEKDKRGKTVVLPLSRSAFRVPPNVFLIGTMNTADRSIALLDTALRRRFGFIELMPDVSLLDQASVSEIPLGPWLEALNRRICEHVGRDARNLQIGHSFLMEGGKPVKDATRFFQVVRDEIIPLLEEYCYEDYDALHAILGEGLVDLTNRAIRHDLFEEPIRQELVQALLAPCPDILTSLKAAATIRSDESGDGCRRGRGGRPGRGDLVSTISLRLAEWQTVSPDTREPDGGCQPRRLIPPCRTWPADSPRAGILEVLELRSGLSVRSTSFVGRVRLGEIEITVVPKLPTNALLKLLRYAYGLRDLRLFPSTTISTQATGLQDILVWQLIEEVKELLGRGLRRAYARREESLSSPRGRIDFQTLASQSALAEASLPCIHHRRDENSLINRVLLAGLKLAATLDVDRSLRVRAGRLADLITESVSPIRLDRQVFGRLERGMDRTTRAYEPAISLIRILADAGGVSLGWGDRTSSPWLPLRHEPLLPGVVGEIPRGQPPRPLRPLGAPAQRDARLRAGLEPSQPASPGSPT